MTALTLFTRPGCHLCEAMRAVVVRAARRVPLSLTEVDISGDAALEARYGREIPVLLIEGRQAARYRVTEEALLRMLETAGGTGGKPE